MKEWKVMYRVDGVNKSLVVHAEHVIDAIEEAQAEWIDKWSIIAVQLVTDYAKKMEGAR